MVVVVSGQSFPQIVLLEQTWDSPRRGFGPGTPRGAESLMGQTALVAASSSTPGQLSFLSPGNSCAWEGFEKEKSQCKNKCSV